MKSKEKEGKVHKIKEQKSKEIKAFTIKKILISAIFIISIIYVYIAYNLYFAGEEVYASETTSSTVLSKNNSNIEKTNTKISNAVKIEISDIINKNFNSNLKEEYIKQETILEYNTTYINDNSLAKETLQVTQEGRQGIQEVTIKKIYENDELIKEEQVGSKIIKASLNKIVKVGTGKNIKKYKVKVGEKVYVTSNRLELKPEPNEETEKIVILEQDQELKVLEVLEDWYKVSFENKVGYVKKESITYKEKIIEKIEEKYNGLENQNNLVNKNISFDMNLSKPSGLSLEQFKKVLTDNKDVNKVLEQNSEYFYYIEKQYNINGMFIAAVAIHESSWATSEISKDKNNLFGYGAYDRNPYDSAYSFNNYAEGIDLLARVFEKYYLNPKGTKIYNEEIAEGTYYNGTSLTAVNTRYATDKNWSNAISNHMRYLYNKL